MLFNSFEFLVFFISVTLLYFILPHKHRWLHLLVASCVFYMYFVPIYILILFFTIIVDYFAGILIENSEGGKRRLFLIMSIIANIGVLAFFKYYNFFIENMNDLFHFAKMSLSLPLLKIILPIGLSFHTFQAMSYTLEVYRGNQKPERHLGIYALYVMFYPQLVAGPIERPQNLLHQFHEPHKFDFVNLKEGLKLILWGLFKKIVIADRLALLVKNVYGNPEKFDGLSLIIATVFFAYQIYCDFSGYSDIALGCARVMGFKLMINFNKPYNAKNISEFWRKWHISLSTWLSDYLFNPIAVGLRNKGIYGIVFAALFTFLISGLWHGAAWKFIIWGALHGIAITYELLTQNTRENIFKKMPINIGNKLGVICTFVYVCFTYIFFRANNISSAFYIVTHMFRGWAKLDSFSHIKTFLNKIGDHDPIIGSFNLIFGLFMILFLIYIQNKTKDKQAIEIVKGKQEWVRWSFYYLLLISILLTGAFNNQEFIYFKF